MVFAVSGFGSIYFQRKAFLKTVFSAGVIVLSYMTLYVFLLKYLYKDYIIDVLKSIPDEAIREKLWYYFSFPILSDNEGLVYIGSAVFVTLFFWVLSYFRLKETEA
jgi:hypothetical protein